ncbi:hypothetical protein DYB26_005452 [Aphanomyces astaci]|uniref:Uncharacterized protein n=2 Tax=Aphanomyces astaci TaxID=112090 RepID=A0A3R7B6J4_APHAT|nr:hypothetical protein DYB26_005452 [Aphanomyces astaci]
MQCLGRGFIAKKGYARLLVQAKEEAKLENQIQRLKDRLREEKARNEQLQRRSSMMLDAPGLDQELEGASGMIDQLRSEMALLKESNAALKAHNATLKKEKDHMERGAYVNGASFTAANHRAIKLQEEVEFLKLAHVRIKDTHKTLRLQSAQGVDTIRHLQHELHQVVCERNALQLGLVNLQNHVQTLDADNHELTTVNARLRVILRQDPVLNRKSRDEVAGLMKTVRHAQEARKPPSSSVPHSLASSSSSSSAAALSMPQLLPEVASILLPKVPRTKNPAQRVIHVVAAPEGPVSGIRQPKGADGALAFPGKVMGMEPNTDDDDVKFRITLLDEEKEVQPPLPTQPSAMKLPLPPPTNVAPFVPGSPWTKQQQPNNSPHIKQPSQRTNNHHPRKPTNDQDRPRSHSNSSSKSTSSTSSQVSQFRRHNSTNHNHSPPPPSQQKYGNNSNARMTPRQNYSNASTYNNSGGYNIQQRTNHHVPPASSVQYVGGGQQNGHNPYAAPFQATTGVLQQSRGQRTGSPPPLPQQPPTPHVNVGRGGRHVEI